MKEDTRSHFYFSRRNFVKGLSIAPLAFSPLLMADRAMANNGPKPRLLVITIPHGLGTKTDKISSTTDLVMGTPQSYQFANRISPLNAIKQHVTVVNPLRGCFWGSSGHYQGPAFVMTGQIDRATQNNTPTARHPSIDAFLEKKLGTGILPAQRLTSGWYKTPLFCWDTSATPKRLPFSNVDIANQTLLRNVAGAQTKNKQQLALLARRKQLMQEALKDIKALKGRIGTAEKQKLEYYVNSIAAATRSLGLLQTQATNCPTPQTYQALDRKTTPEIKKFEHTVDACFEHFRICFQCNLTQFGVLAMTQMPADGYTWVDSKGKTHTTNPCNQPGSAFHQCVAHYGTNVDNRLSYEASIKWFMNKIVKFAQTLHTVKEANGKSLLENTIIVVTGDIADGGHSDADKGFIVIGGSGVPGIKSGKFIKIPTLPRKHQFKFPNDGPACQNNTCQSNYHPAGSRSLVDFWREISHAMGHPIKQFGAAYHNDTSPLGLI